MRDTTRVKWLDRSDADTGVAVRRRRLAVWGAGWLAGTAAVWAGSTFGVWLLPFGCGVVFGAGARRARRRLRLAVLASCLAGICGWGGPLLWLALAGEPIGSTAHAVAALAGLPPFAALVVAATLLTAALQGSCGAWLGWALTPAWRTPTAASEERAQDR